MSESWTDQQILDWLICWGHVEPKEVGRPAFRPSSREPEAYEAAAEAGIWPLAP